jgi:hypothetical protein
MDTTNIRALPGNNIGLMPMAKDKNYDRVDISIALSGAAEKAEKAERAKEKKIRKRSALPYVEKIMKKYPAEGYGYGDLFLYTDLETLVDAEAGSQRFNYVTKVWRNKVFERYGILIEPGPLETYAFQVKNESEKLYSKERFMAKSLKSVRTASKIGLSIDRNKLTFLERRQLDHAQDRAAKIIGCHQVKSYIVLPAA